MQKSTLLIDVKENEEVKTNSFASRPALPPLFFPCITIWLGIILAENLFWQFFCSCSIKSFLIPIFAVVTGIVILGLVSYSKKFKPLTLISISILLCFIVSTLYWNNWNTNTRFLSEASSQGNYTFTLVSDPSQGDYGTSSYANVTLKNDKKVKVRVYWGDSVEPLPLATSFTSYCTIKAIGTNEAGQYYHKNGVSGTVTIHSYKQAHWRVGLQGIVCKIRQKVINNYLAFQSDGANLVLAIITGYDEALSNKVQQSFQSTGLAHLIAVSGAHLSLIAGLASSILSRSRLSKNKKIIFLELLLLLFLFFSGLQISAIRSFCMLSLSFGSSLLKRRSHPLSSLCLTAILILSVVPCSAFSLSFQLSCLSIFGILVFNELFSKHLQAIIQIFSYNLCNTLCLSLSSQIGTLPITISTFSTIPLMSPINNLIVGTIFTLLMPLSFVCSIISLLPFTFCKVLLYIPVFIGSITVSIVSSLAKIPFSCIPAYAPLWVLTIVAILIIFLLWYFWPTPHKKIEQILFLGASVTLPIVLNLIILLSPAEIVMLDVGQGDSILIRDKYHAVLIDTGEDDNILLEQLAQQHIVSLDAVIITHPHADHCGALDALVGRVLIDEIYIGKGAYDILENSNTLTSDDTSEELNELQNTAYELNSKGLSSLKYKDKIKVGTFELTNLTNESDDFNWLDNDGSLCIKVEKENSSFSALLTGDAESDVVESTIRSINKINILKVGHHGSENSLTETILNKLKPEVALISVGEDNDYGHPTETALNLLKNEGIQTFRTDLNGAIHVRITNNSYSIIKEE